MISWTRSFTVEGMSAGNSYKHTPYPELEDVGIRSDSKGIDEEEDMFLQA